MRYFSSFFYKNNCSRYRTNFEVLCNQVTAHLNKYVNLTDINIVKELQKESEVDRDSDKNENKIVEKRKIKNFFENNKYKRE